MSYAELERIYRTGAWADLRSREEEWSEWASGDAIREARSQHADKLTGKKTDLYPLGFNPFKIVAEAHRDIVIGTLPNRSVLPFKILHSNLNLNPVIETILLDSDWASTFQTAVLNMQSRGGTAFKVVWDPTRADLNYGIRIVRYNSSEIWPVYEKTDPWNLVECTIGYEIDSDTAEAMYGIESPSGMNVLYLEHWTRDTYEVWCDGKPVMMRDATGMPMTEADGTPMMCNGYHGLGRVPIVYVPHIREGEFYGTSHVEDILGMVTELNTALPDVGDAVHGITHPRLIGGNFGGKNVRMLPLVDTDGNTVDYILYTGETKAMVGSQPPFLDYPKQPDIPQGAMEYISAVKSLVGLQTRTAPVIMGDLAMGSGRIVGTIFSSLAQPTIAHTQTERQDLAIAMQHLVETSLVMLTVHRGDLLTLGRQVAAITPADLRERVTVTWYPPIPVEAAEQDAILNSGFTAGTRSLLSVLKERGSSEPEAEAELIWGDMERKAMIEAQAAAFLAEATAKSQEKYAPPVAKPAAKTA